MHAGTRDSNADRLRATHKHLLRLLTAHQARLIQQQQPDRPRLQASERPLAPAPSSPMAAAQGRQTLYQVRKHRRFCTLYIVALTQSTASLPEVVGFASALLLTSTAEHLWHLRLPDVNVRDPFRPLRRRALLTLDRIAACLPQDLMAQMVSLDLRPGPL